MTDTRDDQAETTTDAGTENEQHGDGDEQSELRRSIGPAAFALYGAGTILGAGIYVLIGEVAGLAGFWTPFAFVAAAVIAGVNGMVYAELATRESSAGGPATYVRKALGQNWLAVIVGWMIVTTGVVSAATIASGFSNYLRVFVDVPEWLPEVSLVVALAAIASLGVEQSVRFMAFTATCGLVGLGFVYYAGFVSPQADPGRVLSELPSIGDAGVVTGLLSAIFLAIYAFIGFEDMSHMAEEVEDPGFSMPVGIGVALAVCAVLYTATAFAALSILDPDDLSGDEAPLIGVVDAAGVPTWPVIALSLIIISSGVLAQLVMGSRVIYSLGRDDGGAAGDTVGAPQKVARVAERTETPVRATWLCAGVAVAMATFFPLEVLASITSYVMLAIFAISNVSLIVMERREADAPFDLPRWVPYLGLTLCLTLLVGQPFFGGSH